MKYFSTNNPDHKVNFKDAVLNGIAEDGGLYLPEKINKLSKEFISKLGSLSFNEIAYNVAGNFIEDDIPEKDLYKIINDAFDFDAPLIKLDENTHILELFTGPTLAFKDFGARFMARVMSYFLKDSKIDLTILVATSGDTGSAVANGFYNVDGIKVFILYPEGKVSLIQEKQLTTLGGNITALEVNGTFDDCQRLVKQAFLDNQLKEKLFLSSANSINIARLIPQSFYYFYAYSQLNKKELPLIFSVPSGNFGNLTAGLLANEMGLPVYKFIAALNSNDVFLKYIETEKFEAVPSVKTISNAMDVGNPSNFARILSLFDEDHKKISNKIFAASFSDEKTEESIKNIYDNYDYTIDPHGAVGYLALKKFLSENDLKNYNGVILETAHPAKFSDTVNKILKREIEIPAGLKSSVEKEKKSIKISSDFKELKDLLLKLKRNDGVKVG